MITWAQRGREEHHNPVRARPRRADARECALCGCELDAAVLRRVAYIPETTALYGWMSLAEHVEMRCRLYSAFDRNRAAELANAGCENRLFEAGKATRKRILRIVQWPCACRISQSIVFRNPRSGSQSSGDLATRVQ